MPAPPRLAAHRPPPRPSPSSVTLGPIRRHRGPAVWGTDRPALLGTGEHDGAVSTTLPVLTWLPGYQRSWLRTDLLAGLTVSAILVPEGMAYAQLAGEGPEAAFYAAPIGLLPRGVGQFTPTRRGRVVSDRDHLGGDHRAARPAGHRRLRRPHRRTGPAGRAHLGPRRAAAARPDRLVLLDLRAARFRLRSRADHLDETGPENPGSGRQRPELLPAARQGGAQPRGHQPVHARRGRGMHGGD